MLDRIVTGALLVGIALLSVLISYQLAAIGEPRAVWLWSDILGLL